MAFGLAESRIFDAFQIHTTMVHSWDFEDFYQQPAMQRGLTVFQTTSKCYVAIDCVVPMLSKYFGVFQGRATLNPNF